jgi:putative acetyltransferase
VGNALISVILSEARQRGLFELRTDASITARPFFERHGFELVQVQTVVVRGVSMRNFRMKRNV